MKTFMFPPAESEHQRDQQYASNTTRGVGEVVKWAASQFPAMSIDNNLAIVGPNREFVRKLKSALPLDELEAVVRSRVRLVSAVEAAEREFMELFDPVVKGDEQWIVVDSLSNIDGLERPAVIAVGMDTIRIGSVDGMVASRSDIYRAVTRANVLVIVVNELIKGGWLEWLSRVQITADAKFDGVQEQGRLGQGVAAQERLEQMQEEVAESKEEAKLEEDGYSNFENYEQDSLVQAGKQQGSSNTSTPSDSSSTNNNSKIATNSDTSQPVHVPIVQSVWDTCGNTVEAGVGELQFMPLLTGTS
jgi:hypothetical protein